MSEALFTDVLASSALPEGATVGVELDGAPVALVRVGGVAFAVSSQCPHREGQLALGSLQGHFLYCPLHAWCFDVRTGEAFFPRGAKVGCYQVREAGGRIALALPESPLLPSGHLTGG